eukprot:8800941-Alexandrium_andersonii.AAC.1
MLNGCSPTPWVRTRLTQPRCVRAASGARPTRPPLRIASPLCRSQDLLWRLRCRQAECASQK